MKYEKHAQEQHALTMATRPASHCRTTAAAAAVYISYTFINVKNKVSLHSVSKASNCEGTNHSLCDTSIWFCLLCTWKFCVCSLWLAIICWRGRLRTWKQTCVIYGSRGRSINGFMRANCWPLLLCGDSAQPVIAYIVGTISALLCSNDVLFCHCTQHTTRTCPFDVWFYLILLISFNLWVAQLTQSWRGGAFICAVRVRFMCHGTMHIMKENTKLMSKIFTEETSSFHVIST